MATLTVTFQSKELARNTNFCAVVPTSTKTIYDPDKGVADEVGPLRTLYLLNGWDANHEEWLHNTRIAELAFKYQIAVIMPDGENGFYVNHRGSNRYASFITDELVKETRRLFHLSDKREDTWIGGLSMGAYGALRNGLLRPEQFGKILSFSTPVLTEKAEKLKDEGPDMQLKAIIENDSYENFPKDMDLHWLARKAVKEETKPEIYLTCGTEDFLYEENQIFRRLLEDIGYSHTYTESSGEHDWDYWNQHVEEALDWLTGK